MHRVGIALLEGILLDLLGPEFKTRGVYDVDALQLKLPLLLQLDGKIPVLHELSETLPSSWSNLGPDLGKPGQAVDLTKATHAVKV